MQYPFLDLFSGIGGIRLGLEQTGRFKCVKSCEINRNACKTYQANFHEDPFGDVTKIDAASLPKFDLIAGGFPCQSFSHAGERLGFEDARGTLFFEVAKIIDKAKPPAVLLENVKGLTTHDHGKTLAVILNTLRDLGYNVHCETLNARDFGVPQNRERVYIVALNFDCDCDFGDGFNAGFAFPKGTRSPVRLKDVLEPSVEPKFYLSQVYLDGLKRHKILQESKGRGFGYEVLANDGVANAIVCGGMGRERNLVKDEQVPKGSAVYPKDRNSEYVRKLTPRECARLQGFPDSFKIPVGFSTAYRQFGNSVAVPVIRAIGERIAMALDQRKTQPV